MICPTCHVCRKQSDAAKPLHGITLCGTHFDFVSITVENETGMNAVDPANRGHVVALIHSLRTGKFKACWEAVIE